MFMPWRTSSVVSTICHMASATRCCCRGVVGLVLNAFPKNG
jgi:hypothetical protein